MSNAIPDSGATLLNMDEVSRSAMPIAEQLLDSMADALWHLNMGLEVFAGEGVSTRLAVIRPRLQNLYDEVNSLMKELSD